MNMKKEKISGMELVFLLTGYMQGSVLLTTYVETVVNKDAWLVSILGFAATIPFVITYAAIAKRFPGKDLVQIHDIVYGKYFAKVVSTLYVFYFLMILSYNFRFVSDLYVTFLMPETPLKFFLVIFPLVCAYALLKGIEVLARVSHLFVAIAFSVIFITVLLLIPKIDFTNLLPLLEMPIQKYIQSIHIIVGIPFGEIFVFLTFASTLNNVQNSTKNMLTALFLGFMSFFLIAIRNATVLGPTETILTSPAFQAVRLIEVGDVFNRMDILIGIAQSLMVFIKSTVLYYATVKCLSQLLKLRTYMPLIIPIGGIAVVLGATDWQSSPQFIKYSVTTASTFITPFLMIFPLLTLLIAKIRGVSERERGKVK